MPIPKHIEYARELRKSQTPEEKIIWEKVRNKRLKGFKFLRQHPIIIGQNNRPKNFYIADFYCAERKLVVEIDGDIHFHQKEFDDARDYLMNEMSLTVLRFRNDEVASNLKEVIDIIIDHLEYPPCLTLFGFPSLQAERGLRGESKNMWTCPKCNRSFKRKDQQHSCILISRDSLFIKRPPELRKLFNKIEMIVKEFGDFREETVRPDVIFFKTKSTFLAVKVKKDHLDVEFFLDHLEDAPPVYKYLQTSKFRVAHLVAVDRLEDISPQLIKWMKASYHLISG